MPSFVVDPILCTIPETADPSEVARWLAALEGWLAAREESPFEWRHFFDCTEMIEGLGRFPAFEALRAARRITELDVNIPTLLQRLARFFQNEAHDLRGVTATRAAVVAAAEPTIMPPELLARNAPEVRGGLRDGLLCLACDKAAGEQFAVEAHLVTLPFADGANEVSVAGTVALVDPEEMAKRLGTEAVAARFPPSSRPKLLRICAAVAVGLLEEVNVDRRPVRKADAPDSPQQTRDGDKAKAWRLTITKAGAGYRLHYWHVPADGEHRERIELASLLRERDPVVIPET